MSQYDKIKTEDEYGNLRAVDGEKTDSLHRDNIDSKEKETSKEGIKEYSSAETDSERIKALHKRLKSTEKIIHGSQIHKAGGDTS